VKKKNNNKTYGLGKERELKKYLLSLPETIDCVRARGSFGMFDLIWFKEDSCNLISVKSTRQKSCYFTKEIKKIRDFNEPDYCNKWLYIWWAPHKDRQMHGWETIGFSEWYD